MLLLIGTVVALSLTQLSDRSRSNVLLASGSLATAELVAGIATSRYHSARFAASRDRTEIESAFAAIGDAKSRIAQSQAMAVEYGLESVDEMAYLDAQISGFQNELVAIGSAVSAQADDRSVTALADAIDSSGKLLEEQAREIEVRLAAESIASSKALEEFNRLVLTVVTTLVALTILLGLAGAAAFHRHIAGAIRSITRAMTGLAAGHETTAIPGAERSDEIGDMARALAIFRSHADELTALQAREADATRTALRNREAAQAEQAQLLGRLADRFEQEIGAVVTHVAAASSQVHTTASAMSGSASEAVRFADDVAQSLREATEGVTTAATATDQFALSIGEIAQQATRSAQLAREAQASAEQADSTIHVLDRTASEASRLVALIASIAQRTNLLALNASIEAARGGAAGRGFAVVASEVKELAQRTQAATEEVAAQIAAIQGSTGSTVTVLREIEQRIRHMEHNATAIAQAVDEQTVASKELARNLEQAAGGVNYLDHRFVRVTELAQATGVAAEQLLASAGGLQTQARALNEQAVEFVGSVRAA